MLIHQRNGRMPHDPNTSPIMMLDFVKLQHQQQAGDDTQPIESSMHCPLFLAFLALCLLMSSQPCGAVVGENTCHIKLTDADILIIMQWLAINYELFISRIQELRGRKSLQGMKCPNTSLLLRWVS